MKRHEIEVGQVWRDDNKDNRTVKIIEIVNGWSCKVKVECVESGRKSTIDAPAFGGYCNIKPRFTWLSD